MASSGWQSCAANDERLTVRILLFKQCFINPPIFAKKVFFIEKDKDAIKILKENLDCYEGINYEIIEGDINYLMKLYKEALELYRGDFCPELYENWAEEKRLFYRTEILRLIKKLAGYYYDNKKYQKSLELYRSGLNYDRLDKAIHIGIMRCLGNLGDKIGVKRQYQELEKILKKELNTIPDKQTQQVYHRLMNQ